MLPYPESFDAQDRERLFRFLSTFARWECALKRRGFGRRGAHGQAEPNWEAFAITHDDAIAAIQDPQFISARDLLVGSPPKREELNGNQISFVPNPRRQDERYDADYLLRVVRDVRNNLFHGGKFVEGQEPELARDRQLIDAAVTILEAAAVVHDGVRGMLEQPA